MAIICNFIVIQWRGQLNENRRSCQKKKDLKINSKPEDRYCSVSSDYDTRKTPLGHSFSIPELLGSLRVNFSHSSLVSATVSILPVIQTVEQHHCKARQFNVSSIHLSARCEDTMLSSISNLVVEVKTQMKAHFFDYRNRIFIKNFHAVFTLQCKANCIHE